MNTLQKIKEVIAQTLLVDPSEITDTLAAGEIPQWDSMGNMAIIAALEEAFAVEFPLEDLFELNSVNTLADELHKLGK